MFNLECCPVKRKIITNDENISNLVQLKGEEIRNDENTFNLVKTENNIVVMNIFSILFIGVM